MRRLLQMVHSNSEHKRLPLWLKRPLPQGNDGFFTANLLNELRLETVCDNARCPNRPECYAKKTATFMILGNQCTRPCGFCSVSKGDPKEVELDEPGRLAEAAYRLELKHVVITSVTRDDLADGGARHFRDCIDAIRKRCIATIEVLTPDFQGNMKCVDDVMQAEPEVFNHNLETVPRLYRRARGKAEYSRSLLVLKHAKSIRPSCLTKSGLMVGLGETMDELLDVLCDLRDANCDMLTIGQYLAPTPKHMPIFRFITPGEFEWLEVMSRKMGFKHVASGPFVRSSYHAGETISKIKHC